MAKQKVNPKSLNRQISIDAYNYAYQTRNLEIKLFWQRSNYFLVLNTAIATGIILQGIKPNIVSLFLSIFGVLVAALWYGVNLGSKFWQTRWEFKLGQIEANISPDVRLFNTTRDETIDNVATDLERNPHRSKLRIAIDNGILTKPSVSRNMIWLSLLFASFYTIIILYSIIVLCVCNCYAG